MISPSNFSDVRILVVDDQGPDGRLLRHILEHAGYTAVSSTMDPREVCDLHGANRYDLILLDLQMPEMDGFRVLDALKELDPEGYLPVIVITTQPQHKLRALRAGAKDFIGKPFDQAEVLVRIRNVLEVRLLQLEAKNYGEFLEQMVEERTNTLRESEELFRQISTNIPQALWIREFDTGTLRYVNPAWEKISGRDVAPPDQYEKLFESFHPDDKEAALQQTRIFHEGGADFDCRLVRPDGAVRWVHVRTFPICDSLGAVYQVAGIMEDITQRLEEGQRLERLKDEFVWTVSHELRTPLTSIAASLGLLVGGAAGKLPASIGRLLSIAQTNSQRLVRLLNDILDIEKIESGKLVFDLKPVEVRTLSEQAIESTRGFAESFGVRLRLARSVAVEVQADPDRLTQVLTNLLSNAVKFSPTGGEVAVAVERSDGIVRLSVRDQGRGIPEAFKPRVFEKFAQADASDARQKGGTGLGLSIVKQIVTRLGGEVSFDDAPGGGTIFCVDLPALPAPAAKTRPAVSPQDSYTAPQAPPEITAVPQ